MRRGKRGKAGRGLPQGKKKGEKIAILTGNFKSSKEKKGMPSLPRKGESIRSKYKRKGGSHPFCREKRRA